MKLLTLLAAFSLSAFAGGLYLEISQGQAGALLTAKVTACHEPARSTVTAHIVRVVEGQLQRQPVTVTPVANQPGVFSVSGQLPAANVTLELAVTNPEYKNYEPRVLIQAVMGKLLLDTKKHFFSAGPKVADYRQTATD
jgi:hypothetical protein